MMELAVQAGISQILYYTSSDCDEVAKSKLCQITLVVT